LDELALLLKKVIAQRGPPALALTRPATPGAAAMAFCTAC
jgi:hypothetical protein